MRSMVLAMVAVLLVLPSDDAEAQRRRKREDRVRVYRTDAEFWRKLEAEYPDHGAVVLENEQRVEIKWNSAVTRYDSEWTSKRVYAVIDAERADELRQWAEWLPLGGDVKQFEVMVTRGDQQSATEIEEDEIYLEDVRGGFQRQRFAIPTFEDHLVIEITRELYIGRGFIPYLELPVDFEYPTRKSVVIYSEPLPPQGKRNTPLEQAKARYLAYWKLFGPDDVTTEASTRGNVRTRRWIWRDLPARGREPFLPPENGLREVVTVGIDATVYSVTDMAHEFYEEAFRPVVAEIQESEAAAELDGVPRDGGPEVLVRVAHEWIRRNLELDPGWIGYRARPRSIREAREEGAHAVDACAVMVGLLARMGVESHPVWIHRRGFSQPEVRLWNPYFWNHMLVYVPALDPDRSLSKGFVDVVRGEIPTGLLDPWTAGAAGVLLDGRAFPYIETPELASGPGAIDVTVTGAVDDGGTLEGAMAVELEGLAVQAVRGMGPSGRLPGDPDDVLSGIAEILALSDRVEVDPGGLRCDEVGLDTIRIEVPVRATACLQDAGDLELLTTQLVHPAWWDEDLPADARVFRIDLGTPYTYRMTTDVTVPPGTTSLDPPEDVDRAELGFEYRRRSRADTARLTVEEHYTMGRATLPTAEYEALRAHVGDLRLTVADPAALVR